MCSYETNYIYSYLLKILNKSDDFKPQKNYECGSGCSYFMKIEGDIGFNWGVCVNQKSHRCGLLTFENQGCTEFTKNGVIGKEGQ